MTPTNNPPDKRDELADSYELPNRVKETVPDPLVTVFTVTYQHAHYIRDCIEGVLMQKTTFPVEYVIGEDCSTDGTREIVLEYAKKYPDKIRVVTADRNVGLKANAERCRKALRGKYAALCEGDDYWTDPLKLQKQVEFLEANPGYVMCYHAHRVLANDTLSGTIKGKDYTGDELVATPPGIATATKMTRVVSPGITGGDSAQLGGDHFMNAYLGMFGKCKFLPSVGPSVYRAHGKGNWTSKDEKARLHGTIRSKINVYRYFLGQQDHRRTMISLGALGEQMEKSWHLINDKPKPFEANTSRARVVCGGLRLELHYGPFLAALKKKIKGPRKKR